VRATLGTLRGTCAQADDELLMSELLRVHSNMHAVFEAYDAKLAASLAEDEGGGLAAQEATAMHTARPGQADLIGLNDDSPTGGGGVSGQWPVPPGPQLSEMDELAAVLGGASVAEGSTVTGPMPGGAAAEATAPMPAPGGGLLDAQANLPHAGEQHNPAPENPFLLGAHMSSTPYGTTPQPAAEEAALGVPAPSYAPPALSGANHQPAGPMMASSPLVSPPQSMPGVTTQIYGGNAAPVQPQPSQPHAGSNDYGEPATFNPFA